MISMMALGSLACTLVLAIAVASAGHLVLMHSLRVDNRRTRCSWAFARAKYELEMHTISDSLGVDELWLVQTLLGNVERHTRGRGVSVRVADLERMHRDTSRKRALFLRRVARVLRQTTYAWLRSATSTVGGTIYELADTNTGPVERIGRVIKRVSHGAHASVRMLVEPAAELAAVR